MKTPPTPHKGGNIRHWAQRTAEFLRAQTLRVGPGLVLTRTSTGTLLSLRRRRPGSPPEEKKCPFGSIVTWEESEVKKTGIIGGWISCGDKNFNVPNYAVDTSSNGNWLIQIKLEDIELATDYDEEIFLPGVVTTTATPTWEKKSGSGHYDSNTNPPDPESPGTAIIPIGKITVADGKLDFLPTACGSVKIMQCGGFLDVRRYISPFDNIEE